MTKITGIQNALSDYYRAGQDSRGTVDVVDVSQLTEGRQHEMFSFTLIERIGETVRTQPSILRMYDGDRAEENAEYEYTMMEKAGAVDVRVPDVFVFERDAGFLGRPFIVMEKVEGETLGSLSTRSIKTDPAWINSEEARGWVDKFAALLASVHHLDWKALELTFLSSNGWALDENARFLKRLPRFQMASLNKLLECMADWIHNAIREAKNQNLVLLHYDFHFENVLVSDGKIVALLDWCEACTGEAAFDVAWANLILYCTGHEDLIDPFVSAYKRHSGCKLENLTLCEGLAGLRQLSDILILKEAGAGSLNKRADAAALYDINQEMTKTISFMYPRIGIDLDFLKEI